MEKKGYRKLKVWSKAHEMALAIHAMSRTLPREELYGLTSQIRRAAFSVPLNIVEGQASTSKREFLQFLNIANRSLVETEYLLEALRDLKMIDDSVYRELESIRSEVGAMLYALTRTVVEKQAQRAIRPK